MANKIINDLASASALTGSEVIEVEQSGVSKKTTPNDIRTYILPAPAAYTATLGSDIGGGTSTGLKWSRIGKYLKIFGKLTLGTTSSGTDNWFSIPSGINIDTDFVESRITKLGDVLRLTSSSNDVDGAIQHHMCYDSSLGATKIRLSIGVASGVYRQSGGNNFNSSEVINIDSVLIPIEEW